MIRLSMRKKYVIPLAIALFVFGWAQNTVVAKPVSIAQVKAVAQRWMSTSVLPFGGNTRSRIQNIRARQLIRGTTLYYAVDLLPKGCIIVSPDDLIEPVIAYLPNGSAAFSKGNPIIDWLDADLEGRRRALFTSKVIQKQRSSGNYLLNKLNQKKWRDFSSHTMKWSDESADIRVSPLVDTQWGQTGLNNGDICYNYYTPQHYPAGCVATALAQVIRYHSWPERGIGSNEYHIVVDNVSQSAITLGGDGNGGPYPYATMPNNPSSEDMEQIRSIGMLCYDAGVACQMHYKQDGSATSFEAARSALLTTFGYGNSIIYLNSNRDITSNISETCDSNLDAGLPVLLAIGSPNSAHAVVCDGYGYNESTIYHHINFGWSGACDAWYNLPVTTSPYNSAFMAIYNIFPEGIGEVVSGVVTDVEGRPIADAEVSIIANASGEQITFKDTTDKRGIYGIPNIPSDIDVSVTANKAGFLFKTLKVTVGDSRDGSEVCGNVWGANLTGRLVVADSIAPTCKITTSTSITNTNPVEFHVSFSEPVQGFGRESIVVSNGRITGITGDWSDYKVVVHPAVDGVVRCNVKGMSCTDYFGNGNRLSNYASITYDTIAPNVIVARAEEQSNPAETMPIRFQVTFSEAVSELTADDIAVSGTACGIPEISVHGGPIVYLILVNGLVTKGTVTVMVKADSVLDAAGNKNPQSTGTTNSVSYAPDKLAINILFPTPEPSCTRNVPDLVLSGTTVGFGDDITWTWSLNSGSTGTCYGSSDWESSPIILNDGENKLTVSAADTIGNSFTTELMVKYTECVPGDMWSGLSLISLPIEPDCVDPKTATGFLDYWVAYNAQTQRYSKYESSDHFEWFRISAQTPGRGFWARFGEMARVVPSGNIPSQSVNRTIRLQQGWNLIGTPFTSPIEWGLERIMVRVPGGVAQTLAQNTSLVSSWLWGWHSDSKSSTGGNYYLIMESGLNHTLEPWNGYWIKASQECELIIPVP